MPAITHSNTVIKLMVFISFICIDVDAPEIIVANKIRKRKNKNNLKKKKTLYLPFNGALNPWDGPDEPKFPG